MSTGKSFSGDAWQVLKASCQSSPPHPGHSSPPSAAGAFLVAFRHTGSLFGSQIGAKALFIRVLALEQGCLVVHGRRPRFLTVTYSAEPHRPPWGHALTGLTRQQMPPILRRSTQLVNIVNIHNFGLLLLFMAEGREAGSLPGSGSM